jgi:hypothetical protein
MSGQSENFVDADQSAGRAGRRQGTVSELTVIAPLKTGGATRLRAKLAAGEAIRNAVNDRLGTLHDARFVIFDDDTRVLFCTAYDGDWDTYVDDLVRISPDVLDHVFSDLEGWPGVYDPSLKDYIARHQVTASSWYCAYPNSTVRDVHRGQRIAMAFDILRDAARQ